MPVLTRPRHLSKKVNKRGKKCVADRGQRDAPVRRVGIDEQFAPVARDLPARRHEQRVVEKVVVRADAEERRWHPAEVRVQRGDVRGPSLLLGHFRQEEVERETTAIENVGARRDADTPLTWRARQVVRAEHEVRTEEATGSIVLVPHAQQRHRREMRLPADSPAMRSRSEPNSSAVCSSNQHAAASQSSGPAGYGCSGASR